MHKQLTILCLAVSAALSAGSVNAAQVTFRFEATVISLPTGRPFDSGVDVAVGDSIQGRFTFTPNPSQAIDTQSDASASFLIDGKTFATTAEGDRDITFRAQNNLQIIDSAVGNLQDRLSLGAGFDSLPDGLPLSADRSGWSIEMAEFVGLVIGPPGQSGYSGLPLGDDPMIPGDPAIWNLFTENQRIGMGALLNIRLQESGATASDIRQIVTARISRFSLVPEPSTVSIAVICFSCMHFSSGRPNRR